MCYPVLSVYINIYYCLYYCHNTNFTLGHATLIRQTEKCSAEILTTNRQITTTSIHISNMIFNSVPSQ